jgi:F-type H+-transporting ATPase subunit epsilon
MSASTPNSFMLHILSPVQSIFHARVTHVYLCTSEGPLEIMANHAALIAKLVPGPLWLVADNQQEDGMVINGGFLEVNKQGVTVLANAVIHAANLDEARAAAIITNTNATRSNSATKPQSNLELALAVAELKIISRLKRYRSRC